MSARYMADQVLERRVQWHKRIQGKKREKKGKNSGLLSRKMQLPRSLHIYHTVSLSID